MPKSDFYKTKEWRKMRKIALRGVTKCEECERKLGQEPGDTHVHHKYKARFGGQERSTDLEVLCKDCHIDRHRSYKNKQRKHLIGYDRRYV